MDITYRSEEDALEAINKYKIDVKKNRKDLFEWPQKKSKTTKYI